MANHDKNNVTQICASFIWEECSKMRQLCLSIVLSRNPSSTIFDDSFWLELSYLQVAMVAQSCSAHFTALLYAEIYADKIGRQQER